MAPIFATPSDFPRWKPLWPPKRKLLSGTKLDIIWGAPLGDNMMTGTLGMLEALRQRKDLPEFLYV